MTHFCPGSSLTERLLRIARQVIGLQVNKPGLSSQMCPKLNCFLYRDNAAWSTGGTYPVPQLGHFSIMYARSIRMNRPVSEKQFDHAGRNLVACFLNPSSYRLYIFEIYFSAQNERAGRFILDHRQYSPSIVVCESFLIRCTGK